jgi:predicted nucleic acid-binding protein
MVIVDTTVWIDYLNGVETPESEWLDQEATRQRLGLLDLMVCEILQGLASDDEAARVLRQLRRFEIFETGGVEFAAAAAHNYRQMRQGGRTVRKTIDCLIATFCLRGGHSLLHSDRDFDAFEELLHLKVVRA